MKKFLLHLGAWTLAAFILAVAVDMMITCGLRSTDIRKFSVWNEIYRREINADLLVIGSSRAWCGYNTYILDSLLHCNSYNLGFDGHSFDYQLIRYETYRRYNTKPTVILVNIDFLSTLHNSSESQYEREQFFPYVHDAALMDAVAKTKHISWLERHIPLLRYYGYGDLIDNGIEAFLGKKVFFDGGMHKGYRGNDFEWDRASLDRDTMFTVEMDPAIIDKLDGFARESKEEGVHVIFVKSPVYRPLLDRFTDISLSDSVFAAIAARYQIPVINYYYSPIGLDSTNFYNPSHLNTKGSEVFTTGLCKDLSNLLESTGKSCDVP